jgi:MFS family permease
VGAALTIVAGFLVDLLTRAVGPDQVLLVYSGLFLVGFGFGLIGAFCLSRVPEPRMDDQPPQPFLSEIQAPFRERNFRGLLVFLAFWNFAINLPGPFVAVYLLVRLELPLGLVVAFGVLSQFSHVLSLRAWGRLSDRMSNKNVLQVSATIFALSWLIIPMTTLPEKWTMTLPLLALFFITTGIATAGIGLCSGNMAMKLAPQGRATAFLAVNTLVSGAAATISPLVAGLIADLLSKVQVDLSINALLQDQPEAALQVPAISLVGLDFLFIIGFIACLYAIHRLLGVREEGEVKHEIAMRLVFAEVRRTGQAVSNIPGMRVLTTFPFALLMRPVKPRPPRTASQRDVDEPFD